MGGYSPAPGAVKGERRHKKGGSLHTFSCAGQSCLGCPFKPPAAKTDQVPEGDGQHGNVDVASAGRRPRECEARGSNPEPVTTWYSGADPVRSSPNCGGLGSGTGASKLEPIGDGDAHLERGPGKRFDEHPLQEIL